MKIIIIFGIFFLSFLKADSVDLYYALQEKEKLEYLNKITKISLSGIENYSVNPYDLLNNRNSSIEDLISTNIVLSSREKLVISNMQKISNNLIDNNINVNCISIVESSLNLVGITKDECFSIDRRVRALYKVGVSKISLFNNSYIHYNNSINFLNINDINSSKLYFNKLKQEKINDGILEQKIAYMDILSVANLCRKITDSTNKTFLSKKQISDAIVKRARVLHGIAHVIPCTLYTYSQNYSYSSGLVSLPVPLGGEIDSLKDQISLIQAQIVVLDADILIKKTNYETLKAEYDAMPDGFLKILKGIAVAELYNKWQILENEKEQKEETIQTLQNEIINLGGTLD